MINSECAVSEECRLTDDFIDINTDPSCTAEDNATAEHSCINISNASLQESHSDHTSTTAPDMDVSDPEYYRAIVFYLDGSNNWSQIGIGICSYTEKFGENIISVRNEEDSEIFYSTVIGMHTVYRQENDTIIAWTDDGDTEYALSFEEKKGCDYFWAKISALQSVYHSEMEESEHSSSGMHIALIRIDTESNTTGIHLELPVPNLGNLNDIHALIQQTISSSSWTYNSWLARTLTAATARDLEATEDLKTIALIFSAIIPLILKDSLDFFLKEENFNILCDIYEHIFSNTNANRSIKKLCFSGSSIFSDVGSPSPKLDVAVKKTFRAQFLRDVMLPGKVISDEIFSTLNRSIQESYEEIYAVLMEDSELITLISIRLKSSTPNVASQPIITFLHELLRLLGTTGKEHLLYRLLSISDLLFFIDTQLIPTHKDHNRSCIALIECFQKIYHFYSPQVREFMVKTRKELPSSVPILSQIVTIFISTENNALKWTIFQCLKVLFGSATPEALECDEFLGRIYSSTLMNELFAPLSSKDTPTELHFMLLQLISLMVSTQGYKFKYLVLNTPLLNEHVAKFLILPDNPSIQEKKTLLSTLSVLRQIVGLGDEFYNRLLVKYGRNLLDPLVSLLESMAACNDMLTSTLLDLFIEIGAKSENMHLFAYFVRCFHKRFSVLGSNFPLFEKTVFFSKLKSESFENEKEEDLNCDDFVSSQLAPNQEEFVPVPIKKKETEQDNASWEDNLSKTALRKTPTTVRFGKLALSPHSKGTADPKPTNVHDLDTEDSDIIDTLGSSGLDDQPAETPSSIKSPGKCRKDGAIESDADSCLNISVISSPPKKPKIEDTCN